MRNPTPKAKLPRFASRRRPRKAGRRPPALQPAADILHKILTAGAALATILRLLF